MKKKMGCKEYAYESQSKMVDNVNSLLGETLAFFSLLVLIVSIISNYSRLQYQLCAQPKVTESKLAFFLCVGAVI